MLWPRPPHSGSIAQRPCRSCGQSQHLWSGEHHRREVGSARSASEHLDGCRFTSKTLAWREGFEGIWACTSLLHLRAAELPAIAARLPIALRPGGFLYMSFKYGIGERVAGRLDDERRARRTSRRTLAQRGRHTSERSREKRLIGAMARYHPDRDPYRFSTRRPAGPPTVWWTTGPSFRMLSASGRPSNSTSWTTPSCKITTRARATSSRSCKSNSRPQHRLRGSYSKAFVGEGTMQRALRTKPLRSLRADDGRIGRPFRHFEATKLPIVSTSKIVPAGKGSKTFRLIISPDNGKYWSRSQLGNVRELRSGCYLIVS